MLRRIHQIRKAQTQDFDGHPSRKDNRDLAVHYPAEFTVCDRAHIIGGHIIQTQHNTYPAPDRGLCNDATAGLRVAHARLAQKARVAR